MNSLPRVKERSAKRLGRGRGSGKGGHTVGRGQKGQKARGSIGILFEGIKVKKSLLKKLPLQRGKGKNKGDAKPIIVKLEYLNLLPAGCKVNLEILSKEGIVKKEDAEELGVKILGDGEVAKKFTVEIPISKNAAKKIEAAGGKVVRS
ncbi:uL15 family ribosomal protein [Candidatus Woesebacteria bacterium]|nr:uL15 family ribosomal protein [Candidatus Woesebacteria bacterium]